ncbi:hypothetical protein BURPS406E_B0952 [Burkholderia pseudomallei 406e]|nr:hypothetical protein BMAFMH_B0938 [Burkholderia mallei FMH]EDK59940.1 hypothetical protein BMAJHU_B0910 [Burkholderia mallei JHU]EDO82825.1 hypothetical protein BURPS406E_B0952 [Burkholderia pseudomallei 406e]EDP87790.1 hypothetical protein BMA10399_I0370 [Burkholderia mallei ATCC 10399]
MPGTLAAHQPASPSSLGRAIAPAGVAINVHWAAPRATRSGADFIGPR